MTLHEAMQDVLHRAGEPLTSREIADEINRRGLYERGDGAQLGASQVSARARNYPCLFARTAGNTRIALCSKPK